MSHTTEPWLLNIHVQHRIGVDSTLYGHIHINGIEGDCDFTE